MQFDTNGEQIKPPKWPGTEGAESPNPQDMSHMVQIGTLIADLTKISEQFGNTCVYIRRGGLSWGAVALNRKADDEKNGVFDLQAKHDRDMQARLKQIERLKADRDSEREARHKLDAALRGKDDMMSKVVARAQAAGVDFSDFQS